MPEFDWFPLNGVYEPVGEIEGEERAGKEDAREFVDAGRVLDRSRRVYRQRRHALERQPPVNGRRLLTDVRRGRRASSVDCCRCRDGGRRHRWRRRRRCATVAGRRHHQTVTGVNALLHTHTHSSLHTAGSVTSTAPCCARQRQTIYPPEQSK